ncbi:hypothetical protein Vadar_001754 [Vaccinium darrowii]|uniref:Uncharacterized protein n=1 Tax=Vaccinium darrowii TaxID=229202 RepID=A0ACB7WX09_9ERIC|nr:hypothetical protein Vadar_001754 [Vaccinium darrowii]
MYLHVLPFLLSWLLLAAQPTRATNTAANIAAVTDSSFFVSKPGCPLKCGNVTVPYPFGMGSDCSIGPWFNITCDTGSYPPKPYIGNNSNSIEVLSISQTQVWAPILFTYQCYNETGGLTTSNSFGPDLFLVYNDTTSPYSFSDTANKVTVVGCDDLAILSTTAIGEIGGCMPTCLAALAMNFTTNCNGFGCCQSDIPKGLEVTNLSIGTIVDHSKEILVVLVVIITLVMEKQTELVALHNSQ